MAFGQSSRSTATAQCWQLLPALHAEQVYLILDEFIMGGEIQETSKKVELAATQCPAACIPSAAFVVSPARVRILRGLPNPCRSSWSG